MHVAQKKKKNQLGFLESEKKNSTAHSKVPKMNKDEIQKKKKKKRTRGPCHTHPDLSLKKAAHNLGAEIPQLTSRCGHNIQDKTLQTGNYVQCDQGWMGCWRRNLTHSSLASLERIDPKSSVLTQFLRSEPEDPPRKFKARQGNACWVTPAVKSSRSRISSVPLLSSRFLPSFSFLFLFFSQTNAPLYFPIFTNSCSKIDRFFFFFFFNFFEKFFFSDVCKRGRLFSHFRRVFD